MYTCLSYFDYLIYVSVLMKNIQTNKLAGAVTLGKLNSDKPRHGWMAIPDRILKHESLCWCFTSVFRITS